MSNKALLQHLSSFEGVFCSGFFIPDQSVVTALSLLFEKVHFLNQLEYAIEFSKKYKLHLNEDIDLSEMVIEPAGSHSDDPLAELTEEQKRTVKSYLFLSDQFFIHNALLFPEVFNCSLFPDNEVVTATLIKEGKPGEKNLYRVTKNPLMVCTDGFEEVAKLVDSGKIPIFTNSGKFLLPSSVTKPTAQQIASHLALTSIAMVLPATKAARCEDILEARERLRDHLPPFWSAMLKLSVELTKRIEENTSPSDVQHEVNSAVATIVRPALIDLVDKLEKERQNWFKNILFSTASTLRVIAGKPPTDLAGLISGSILAGADISMDFAQQLRKVEALKQESGLVYLIELNKFFNKKASAN